MVIVYDKNIPSSYSTVPLFCRFLVALLCIKTCPAPPQLWGHLNNSNKFQVCFTLPDDFVDQSRFRCQISSNPTERGPIDRAKVSSRMRYQWGLALNTFRLLQRHGIAQIILHALALPSSRRLVSF